MNRDCSDGTAYYGIGTYIFVVDIFAIFKSTSTNEVREKNYPIILAMNTFMGCFLEGVRHIAVLRCVKVSE